MYLSGRRQLLEYRLQVQWSIDQIAQSSKRNSWLALPNSESNPHDYCVSCRNGSKTTAGGIIRNLLHYWLARSCAQLLAHGIIDDISGAKFYSIAGGVAMAALWQAWVRFALQCFHCQCVRSGEPGPRQLLIQGDREIIKVPIRLMPRPYAHACKRVWLHKSKSLGSLRNLKEFNDIAKRRLLEYRSSVRKNLCTSVWVKLLQFTLA